MNIKVIIISLVALFAIGAGATSLIKKQTEYKIEHKAEVPQTVGEDGRYQAGSPEQYWIDPAPATVWKLTKSKRWRTAAIIVLILVCVYLGACGAGAAVYNHKVFFGGLVAAAACWIAAYSSALDNNTRKLSPSEYEAVKDNVESLWTKDNLIK